jgi:uncharacterized membrane protein
VAIAAPTKGGYIVSKTEIVILYFLTCLVFFLVDIIWLGLVARGFYRSQLGSLLLAKPNWAAAIIFYLLFVVGILIFAVLPAVDDGEVQKAIVFGALFGFFTYATYDLTNYSTLKDWPFVIVVVDIIWGVVLSTTVATSSYFIARWIS